jgi:hypothetical protein
MTRSTPGNDLDRYRQLLAAATDEARRLELIRILTAEGARQKLAAETNRLKWPLNPAASRHA